MKSALRLLALGLLCVQSAIDRALGRPFPLALGVDAPATAETAAAAATTAPAATASTPTLTSAIKGLFSVAGDKTKLGTDLAQARADLAARTTERDAARNEAATAIAQLTALAGFFGLKPADLAGKDAAACATLLAEKISAAAVEQLAAANIPQASLPKPSPHGDAPKSYADHVAAYNKMPSATAEEADARAAYYKTHIAKHAGNN